MGRFITCHNHSDMTTVVATIGAALSRFGGNE